MPIRCTMDVSRNNGPSMDDAARPEIHDYRSYGRVRYLAFAAPIMVLAVTNLCVATWRLFPKEGARNVEALILVVATILAPLIWPLLKLLNERVEVVGTRVSRRNRFGRITLEMDLSEVTGFRTAGKKIWRRRTVETSRGKLTYGATISRRAELDRLFMSRLGMRLPTAVPTPRHWDGSASYAINPTAHGLLVLTLALGGLSLLLDVSMIRMAIAHHRPLQNEISMLGSSIVILALPVLLLSTQYRFRRIDVSNDSVSFVALFSRRSLTIPFDQIQSVDMVNSGRGCAGVVYTANRSLNLVSMDPMLGIVLAWLSKVTGSPDP